MRTIEKTIYKFDELDECAKSRAREWYRSRLEYPWWAEVQSSLREFCDEFGIKVLDYSTWDNDAKPDFKKTAHIGGCGSSSMAMALKAIARAAGAKGELLIV